jgi:hypothetical protein
MFKLTPEADIIETCCLTIIELPPVFLKEVFGEPSQDSGYKASGCYKFTNGSGELFTVYDWKATTLYFGPNSGTSTSEEFWSSEEFDVLHIGGREESNPSKFITWLINQYEEFRSASFSKDLINVFRH